MNNISLKKAHHQSASTKANNYIEFMLKLQVHICKLQVDNSKALKSRENMKHGRKAPLFCMTADKVYFGPIPLVLP